MNSPAPGGNRRWHCGLTQGAPYADGHRHGLPERHAEPKAEAIAAAQFKGVEIFENDLLGFSGKPADVRRMASDLGLEIITFQRFLPGITRY